MQKLHVTRSEKYDFKREPKTEVDGAEMTCCGRLFHTRIVATGKARLPYTLV